MLDCLIIGGGVAGMQCALVLGSAKEKRYAKDKNIAIIAHQESSHLKNALFNNVIGLPLGKLGSDILVETKEQLSEMYPHVNQINEEKVVAVLRNDNEGYKVVTDKSEYQSKIVIVALNYAKPFEIGGLEQYVEPHIRAAVQKDRIQLRNFNHLIADGLYCCGTIAGHRSQFAIAAGSGAAVATDILTLWNDNIPSKIHDKIAKK